MTRIAFLSWRDTTHPDGGGSEVYVEQMAAQLAARGHQVTIRCAAHPGAPPRETKDGVTIERRGGRLTVYLRGLLWLLTPAGRRQQVVVDVINAIPFGAALVRRRGLVGLVHHVHRAQWRIIYPGVAGRVGWFVESRLVPWMYHRVPIITVSEPSRRALIDLGFHPERLSVVHNGTPALPAPRVQRSLTPRLAVLARLVPHKRVEDAVDVVTALAPEFPGLELDIIGDGWWADRVDAHVAARGAGDLVRRHGHVDEQTKSDLLSAAWVCLVPSVQEGWCLAIVEAAELGTPSVAYADAGGVTESIQDGRTGVLVEDLDAMVAAVRELLTDDDRRQGMAMAARERAANFTWSVTSTAFERALERVHSP